MSVAVPVRSGTRPSHSQLTVVLHTLATLAPPLVRMCHSPAFMCLGTACSVNFEIRNGFEVRSASPRKISTRRPAVARPPLPQPPKGPSPKPQGQAKLRYRHNAPFQIQRGTQCAHGTCTWVGFEAMHHYLMLDCAEGLHSPSRLTRSLSAQLLHSSHALQTSPAWRLRFFDRHSRQRVGAA